MNRLDLAFNKSVLIGCPWSRRLHPPARRFKHVVDLSGVLAIAVANDSWTLPVPDTFIVNQDGTIAELWADVDYRRRVEPDDFLNTLRVLSEE